MFSPRYFYTLVLWLLLPHVFFHLWWRARKQPEYLHHVGERFGRYTVTSDKPVIWLHAVSVGETRALVSLVKALREHYPEYQLLITHTTPTGRATSEQLYGDKVLRVYLPYDYPFAVKRFLRHFRPHIGVLVETEIWFNLIHACHRQKIPLLLLNARLSERSARRYAHFPGLVRAGLHELHLIAAQTEDDALRLASLGSLAVPVMGNLKYDIDPPPAMLELGQMLRQRFGSSRRVFLAASTREGEEALLLEALKQLDMPELLTVIVPRHPQRFDEVAALIAAHGFSMVRRSTSDPVLPETRIVLGDSMGEMFAYYAACDIAFIGGSLLPLGGQNLLEACVLGKPVLLGPHTFNFADAAERAVACGAAIRVNSAEALVQQVRQLLPDMRRLEQMGENGRCFVNANRGATAMALKFIASAISEAVDKRGLPSR